MTLIILFILIIAIIVHYLKPTCAKFITKLHIINLKANKNIEIIQGIELELNDNKNINLL